MREPNLQKWDAPFCVEVLLIHLEVIVTALILFAAVLKVQFLAQFLPSLQ